MSRVLITGATGFVGSAVAREMIAAGWDVRALVRADSDRENIDGLPVEPVTGDLTEAASLRAAADGCDAVFHVAADYRLWVPDSRPLYRTNVDGTRNVLEASRDAGVRRVVVTSSVATLGLNADGTPADEDTAVTLDDMIGDYKRSKFLAERLASEFARETGLDVVIVNPSAPVGPRDIKPTPTGQMILDAAAGRMPAYVDTGLNVVHVDDVAIGHRLALERGQAGRRYILGCENMSLAEIAGAAARAGGAKAPRIRLPRLPLYPVAAVAELIARRTGRAPRITLDGLRLAGKHMYFSIDRARQELGFDPRPAQDAIRDGVEWFRAAGYF